MKKSVWLGLTLALLACDKETPTAPPPAQTAAPRTAPVAPPPAAPAEATAEPTPVQTADGELVGSAVGDYLNGQVCLELYLNGTYDQDLVFDAKRNLATAGVFSADPCDVNSAVASCKTKHTDDGLTETLVGYYFAIPLDVAEQDCADDGGLFTAF